MIWTIISSLLVFFISIWVGEKRLLKLEQITLRRLLLIGIIGLTLFLVLRFIHNLGFFPQDLAASVMSGMYASTAGFFGGAAYAQFQMKKSFGNIEYVNNAFISDLLPNIIALTIIILGIARSSIFSELPITPIRATSGLSLICIGIYAVTLRTTPEFRRKGFIILDRKIEWKNLVAYQWYQDQVIELEFRYQNEIRFHRTVIKPEDEQKVEKLLASKMIAKLEKQEESDS